MCASNLGFEAYLKPKGKGVCDMPHLKPERGNPAFRNFRGLSRNGLLGFPLMDVNSIIKQFKVDTQKNCTAILLGGSSKVARSDRQSREYPDSIPSQEGKGMWRNT